MLICYRADLTHSVKFVKTGTFYICLEINKEIISTEKNLVSYPIESPNFNDGSFSILEGEISRLRLTFSRLRDMYWSVAT